MKSKKDFTIIVKPTHSCNLKCKYCYIEKTAENSMMKDETLKNLIFQPMNFFGEGGAVHYIWHGGEPLLMGVNFYKKVLKFQDRAKKETGCNYYNCLQSNCTLLDKEWIDFLRDNDISVGSSVDGPESIHDQQRVFNDGSGTLDIVLKNIELSSKNEFIISSIAVVTKKTIEKFDEFYGFFKTHDLSTKINVLVNSGTALDNLTDLEVTPKQYGQFLIDLFDKWVNEDKPVLNLSITLNGLITTTILNSGPTCDFSGNCQEKFISIGPKGDIYPCGRFDGLKDFLYGNINETDGFKKALKNPKRIILLERGSDPECVVCDTYDICHSGCMHNAFLKGDIMGKDYYCLSRKMIYAHVKKFLEKELNVAEIKQ